MSLSPSPHSESISCEKEREDKLRETTSSNLAHLLGSNFREMTNLMAEMVSLTRDHQKRTQELFRLH